MDTRGEARQRTFTDKELEVMFERIHHITLTYLFDLPTTLVLEVARYVLYRQKMLRPYCGPGKDWA